MTTLDPVVNHVADDALPWADAGDGVELKVLRVDLDAGVWVVRNRFQPGVLVPTHRHTGNVHGFTVSGRWRYVEYGVEYLAGSFIYEPAGSVHTLEVPADNTGPTEALFVIEGANLNLDADGRVDSVTDARSVLAAYERLCELQGLGRPTDVLR